MKRLTNIILIGGAIMSVPILAYIVPLFGIREEFYHFSYVATFWPEVSNTIATGITDHDIDSPIRDLCIYNLNGTLMKRIPQTGVSIKSVLSELPKGFYIVKEATKTYKVYNGE